MRRFVLVFLCYFIILLTYDFGLAFQVAGNLLDQISLLTSSVKSLSAKPHAFEIVTPQKAFSFACKDAQDLLQWMTALQKGIKSAINGGVPSPKV